MKIEHEQHGLDVLLEKRRLTVAALAFVTATRREPGSELAAFKSSTLTTAIAELDEEIQEQRRRVTQAIYEKAKADAN